VIALASGADLYLALGILAASLSAFGWGAYKSRRDNTPNPYDPDEV
jgi:hypothetical protein